MKSVSCLELHAKACRPVQSKQQLLPIIGVIWMVFVYKNFGVGLAITGVMLNCHLRAGDKLRNTADAKPKNARIAI